MKMVVGAWRLALGAGVAQAELVAFRDYDADTGTFTNAVRVCTFVTSETRTLENGWYAVQGTVTIPSDTSLTVNVYGTMTRAEVEGNAGGHAPAGARRNQVI